MELRTVQALRGPNLWARFPVLEARVDLGPFKGVSAETVPGFRERLTAWLPPAVEPRRGAGARGGCCEPQRLGGCLAQVLGRVTLELQSRVGPEVGFSRTRATGEECV